MNGQMKGWIGRWKDEWEYKRINGKIKEWMGKWKDEWKDKRIGWSKDEWEDKDYLEVERMNWKMKGRMN